MEEKTRNYLTRIASRICETGGPGAERSEAIGRRRRDSAGGN